MPKEGENDDKVPKYPPEPPDEGDEPDIDKLFEELFKENEGEKGGGGENKNNLGPIDEEDKFITPDLIQLPPKWFYEKVKNLNLPPKIRLTERIKQVLDKVYYEGATKGDLVVKYKFPSSTVNTAFNRIIKVWNLYKTGVIQLDGVPEAPEVQSDKGGKSKDGVSSYLNNLTYKTTTFKEIDRAIAGLLRPQVEKSTQFQEVMTRIGMLTTYTLLQLGGVDKRMFVKLAENVTSDPEALYKYVATQLATLINAVDTDQLKNITTEMMVLKGENNALKNRIAELEYELDKYREWLYTAGKVLSMVLDKLSSREKWEVLRWLITYEYLRNAPHPGGGVANGGGEEGH